MSCHSETKNKQKNTSTVFTHLSSFFFLNQSQPSIYLHSGWGLVSGQEAPQATKPKQLELMCKMSVCLNNLSSYNQTCFYKARMENKGEMHWIIRVRHACQPSRGAVLHKTNKSLQLLGSTDSNQNPHKWIGHICVPLVTYVFKWLVGSENWNMWDSSGISQSYNEL